MARDINIKWELIHTQTSSKSYKCGRGDFYVIYCINMANKRNLLGPRQMRIKNLKKMKKILNICEQKHEKKNFISN